MLSQARRAMAANARGSSNTVTCYMHPQADAMSLYRWQDDITGVARLMDACSERVYTSAGPPVGDQASDRP